ncbi:MAG: asparaginase [Clostridia bacterium]|nr:asparaginase [Clostridia bacterium]
MKILVIFTGGTIGSKTKNGYISADDSTNYILINSYKKKSDIDFVCHNPYTILSENLSATQINILQKEIAENIDNGYDGIIVTHGTDTLQYTSTAVEYAFSNAKIPIIFVSSSLPLENKNANGYANFEAAVEFICQRVSSGVFVSYKNSNKICVDFYIPSTICRHAECTSNIHSINSKIFASYNGVVKFENCRYNFSLHSQVTEYITNPGILVIDSYPGNNYSYSLENVNAVILNPYHSATLNTSSEYFQNFCLNAKQKNIPVFLVNAPGGITYESTKEYKDLGIITLPLCTFVSAYVKLWLGISRNYDLREFMKTAISNEYNK